MGWSDSHVEQKNYSNMISLASRNPACWVLSKRVSLLDDDTTSDRLPTHAMWSFVKNVEDVEEVVRIANSDDPQINRLQLENAENINVPTELVIKRLREKNRFLEEQVSKLRRVENPCEAVVELVEENLEGKADDPDFPQKCHALVLDKLRDMIDNAQDLDVVGGLGIGMDLVCGPGRKVLLVLR